VESGRSRTGTLVGVPYGSIARLILLYLQTEAVRTNTPEVELGRSMKSWMGRMSLTTGGKTYQLVTEQARRISACRLTFFTDRVSLNRSTPVTWTALHGQFGAGFKALRQLKPTFREALAIALAVYPEAKVGVEAAGVVLHPSPPAVARSEAKRIGLG